MSTRISGLSIVTSTYQRPNDTIELIDSIQNSYELFEDVMGEHPLDLECLVCLKRSDQRTLSALRTIDWNPLTILKTPRRWASYNRDLGFEHAAHDYVVSVDSDCVVALDWIRNIVRALREYDRPAAVQGNYYLDYFPEMNWVTRSERRADRSRFESGQLDSRNLVLKYDIYLEIGGYDTERRFAEAAEDLMLRNRIENVGGEVYMDEGIQVQHKYPTDVWGNLRRYHRYGRGSHHISRRHPHLYRDQFSASAQCQSVLRKVRDGLAGRSRYNSDEIAYEVLKTTAFTAGSIRQKWLDPESSDS